MTSGYSLRSVLVILAAVGLFMEPVRCNRWSMDSNPSIQRRRLDELSNMIRFKMDVSAAETYVGYGNFCGKGGSGVPVDATDRCCQAHDNCYGDVSAMAKQGSCPQRFSVYSTQYDWSKEAGAKIVCDKDQESCHQELCICDQVFTDCLNENTDTYNAKNLGVLSGATRYLAGKLEENPSWVSKIAKIRDIFGRR